MAVELSRGIPHSGATCRAAAHPPFRSRRLAQRELPYLEHDQIYLIFAEYEKRGAPWSTVTPGQWAVAILVVALLFSAIIAGVAYFLLQLLRAL